MNNYLTIVKREIKTQSVIALCRLLDCRAISLCDEKTEIANIVLRQIRKLDFILRSY